MSMTKIIAHDLELVVIVHALTNVETLPPQKEICIDFRSWRV